MVSGVTVPLRRRCGPRLCGQLVAGDRSAYTYLPQSVDHFPEAGALAGMLQDVGLVGVGYLRMGFGTVALHWGSKAPD